MKINLNRVVIESVMESVRKSNQFRDNELIIDRGVIDIGGEWGEFEYLLLEDHELDDIFYYFESDLDGNLEPMTIKGPKDEVLDWIRNKVAKSSSQDELIKNLSMGYAPYFSTTDYIEDPYYDRANKLLKEGKPAPKKRGEFLPGDIIPEDVLMEVERDLDKLAKSVGIHTWITNLRTVHRNRRDGEAYLWQADWEPGNPLKWGVMNNLKGLKSSSLLKAVNGDFSEVKRVFMEWERKNRPKIARRLRYNKLLEELSSMSESDQLEVIREGKDRLLITAMYWGSEYSNVRSEASRLALRD